METVEGKVINEIYSSEDDFKILNIENSGNVLTIKGTMPNVEVLDVIECEGFFVNHESFGRQFSVKRFEKKFPEGSESIYEYLYEGGIKGVGPTLAKRIVDEFGKDSLDVMYSDPEKLATISGISKRMAKEIGQEFRQKREFYDVTTFFRPYNLRIEDVNSMYKKYGVDIIDIVNDNPYIILENTVNVRFSEIDNIAINRGLSPNSDSRLMAAIEFLLKVSISNGNTYVDKNVLLNKVQEVTGADSDYIVKALQELKVRHKISEDDDRIMLEALDLAELEIAEKINALTQSKVKRVTKVDEKIKVLEALWKIDLTEDQRIGIKAAIKNPVTVLTGGPGTGKTTITKFIVNILKDSDLEVEIAAPTGKAAKRISEVTEESASTVHRLLELQKYDDNNNKSLFAETKMVDADALILDEASMIDTFLMTYILRSVSLGMRLIIIGDVNQLPSVGSGKVLEDIVNSEIVEVVSLKKIFRQALKSNIIVNAHRVNSGEVLKIYEDKDNDLHIIDLNSGDLQASRLMQILEKEISKDGLVSFFINSQILVQTKQGPVGTFSLNQKIQEKFNEYYNSDKSLSYGKVRFAKNDRIMQVKNDYEQVWELDKITGSGVFNGEMGWIRDISKDGVVYIEFDDGKKAEYSKKELENIIHAYAITVHKSQGSEFDRVIFMLPNSAPMLLTRNILYTGISRAKEDLTIISSKYILNSMAEREVINKRKTNLCARLKRYS